MLQGFRYILWALLLCVGALFGQTQSKIAYLNVEFPKVDTSLYVGQNIEVKYALTLLSGAKLISADVLDLSPKNNVVLKSRGKNWRADNNGVLLNTYTYNITAQNVIIPALRVRVASSDGSYEEEVIAQGAKIQAIELSSNPNYIHVIADMLEVVDYRVREYDEANNIVIFQFESKGAYLESMKIAQYPKQGLENSKVVDGITYGIYYVVLDKSIRSLSFDYFNITQHQFVTLTLPIHLVRNTLNAQSGDIKPRNTFLIFKNLFIGGLIIFTLCVWLVFKRIRKIALLVLAILVALILYNVFFTRDSGIAQIGANISIIPTHNSTITEVIKTPTRVDIIGEYGDYYKVIIDTKVGWIRKDHVSKN